MVGHSVLHGLGNGKSVEKVVQQVVWQNGARVPVQNVQYPQLPTLKISFILETRFKLGCHDEDILGTVQGEGVD